MRDEFTAYLMENAEVDYNDLHSMGLGHNAFEVEIDYSEEDDLYDFFMGA